MSNNNNTSACIANIGPRQRRMRVFLGLIVHTIAILTATAFIHYHVSPWWKASLFIPFFIGFLGLIQAQKKVCVIFANRGTRNMDSGSEPIEDENISHAIQKKARGIYIISLISAIFMTIVIVYI